jgi:carbamate kinase
MVASPEPLAIVEADAIRSLAAAGFLVVAGGGGGVPVTRVDGGLRGVDAVIDKDLAAALLAAATGADALVLVTGVDRVALDFGTNRERPVGAMTTDEAERHLRAGQFPPGSMGPKVAAAVRFLRAGGKLAVITSPRRLAAALDGRHGTRIVPARTRAEARR